MNKALSIKKSRALALLITGVLAAGAEAEQSRNIGVAVNRQQDHPGMNLTLEMQLLQNGASRSLGLSQSRDPNPAEPTVRINDRVKLCFQTTRAGYITLWSHGVDGEIALIYPNALSHGGAQVRAERVDADQQVCLGGDDSPFRFMVLPPAGEAEVYLHWTANEDEQLGQQDYPVIGKDIGNASRSADDYAAATVTYRIVDDD